MEAQEALDAAAIWAQRSPCRKSQRGVVIWDTESGFIAAGWNHKPLGVCYGSKTCRDRCSKVCIHAEAHALLKTADARGRHMLHVKVVNGEAVPSGPPSCWQCSRLILTAGIETMWLLHEDGLTDYSAEEFHRMTLQHCGLL